MKGEAPRALRPAEEFAAATPSEVPALLLVLALLSLSVLAWPTVLKWILPLDWSIRGHLEHRRQAATVLSVGLAVLGFFVVLTRSRINSWYLRTFPSFRHLFGALALVGVSALLSLGCIEVALVMLGLPFSGKWIPSETSLGQYDPEIGWVYIPNHSATQRFGSARREVPMHFDAIGARVRNPNVHHDPTTPTVILAGCSFTMGHGLPWEETVAGQLEAMTDFPLQVVNLGVQGYGTDQTLLLTKRHIDDFSTRVVVYTFIDDHVSRNANGDRRLFSRLSSANFLGTKPLFEVSQDGSLTLREQPHRYEDVWELHVWSYLRLAWTKWGPVPDESLTRALIREFRRQVEAKGAKFLLVRWPGSQFRFDDPDLRIVDLGAVAPPDFRNWMIKGDSHPDARADAFVATVLADTIRGILPASNARSGSQGHHEP